MIEFLDTKFVAKFWSRFRRAKRIRAGVSTPCLEWAGARRSGTHRYGNVHVGEKTCVVHRVAWAIAHKTWVPAELLVCHKCDNPPCGDPTHLFLGTVQDNTDDRQRKGRGIFISRSGEDHPHSKLTKNDVLEIRRARARGVDLLSLANKFGITRSAVSLVARGVAWAAVGGPRTNTKVVIKDLHGKRTTLKLLSRRYGIPYTALTNRRRKGWAMRRALTQPVKTDRRRKL